MARYENAIYDGIVTRLERELELDGLEEGDDIPVSTMTTALSISRPVVAFYLLIMILAWLQKTWSYQRLVQETQAKE